MLGIQSKYWKPGFVLGSPYFHLCFEYCTLYHGMELHSRNECRLLANNMKCDLYSFFGTSNFFCAQNGLD